MKKLGILVLIASLWSYQDLRAQNLPDSVPDTGISGLYEVMMGVKDPKYWIQYFEEFGFSLKDSAHLTGQQAEKIYGVKSALRSYRMQNGQVDSHGLLRLMVWEQPSSPGFGYSAPETIGSRMAVMRTKDIIRITDIFQLERENGKPWYVVEPIFDDLYSLSEGKNDFFNRPVGVRESAIYGDGIVHVFFQRYGYQIPGYGEIHENSPLQTSEFTHHDFFVPGPTMKSSSYLYKALGFKPEAAPAINGDWAKGPRRVFDMEPAFTHLYLGLVSPNNICGKLKLFVAQQPKPDRSHLQKIGALGISQHSLYTPKLKMVHELLRKEGIQPSPIQKNEFGESSFVFTGPDGIAWQLLEEPKVTYSIKKSVEFNPINN